jgi:DNA-binding NarL/FixJ family response regulator
MNIKIMLVDDHKMVSEALGKHLASEPDIAVIAEAYDCGTALQLAKETMPDVVVMAMSIMSANGFEALRNILEKVPQCRMIALSIDTDRRYVVDAFKAGARGYVLKESTCEVLIEAIRSVAGNNGYMDPNVNNVVIYEQTEQPHQPDPRNKQKPLSSSERKVHLLIAEGKKTREAACALDISPKTIESHRQQIMQKLKLGNCADLTRHLNEPGTPYKQTHLSSRKREILKLIAEGNTIREVACALDINHKTVEAHRRKIMRKLNIDNVADLTRHLNESGVPHEQSALSSREREVLQLIAEGENTKAVAFSLDISSKTVESHRLNIMQKLNLSNVADLTRYAIQEGIISL